MRFVAWLALTFTLLSGLGVQNAAHKGYGVDPNGRANAIDGGGAMDPNGGTLHTERNCYTACVDPNG